MKPIIGMLAEVDDERLTHVRPAYVHAIEAAGGLPLLLPYIEDAEAVADFVALCDGFFFTGGMDVDPARYGEKIKPTCGTIQRYRDDLEFRVLGEVLKTDKPILAICRGAQLVNIAFGGTLYQDLPSEYDTSVLHRQRESDFAPSHPILVERGTPLFELVGKATMMGNSFHHQAIKTLGEGLEVMARAEDGMIEAVWATRARYLRAYQWHPERLYDLDADNRTVFAEFISEARKTQRHT